MNAAVFKRPSRNRPGRVRNRGIVTKHYLKGLDAVGEDLETETLGFLVVSCAHGHFGGADRQQQGSARQLESGPREQRGAD